MSPEMTEETQNILAMFQTLPIDQQKLFLTAVKTNDDIELVKKNKRKVKRENEDKLFLQDHPEFITFNHYLSGVVCKDTIDESTRQNFQQRFEHVYIIGNGCEHCQCQILQILRSSLKYYEGWSDEELVRIKTAVETIESISLKRKQDTKIIFPDFFFKEKEKTPALHIMI